MMTKMHHCPLPESIIQITTRNLAVYESTVTKLWKMINVVYPILFFFKLLFLIPSRLKMMELLSCGLFSIAM